MGMRMIKDRFYAGAIHFVSFIERVKGADAFIADSGQKNIIHGDSFVRIIGAVKNRSGEYSVGSAKRLLLCIHHRAVKKQIR